MFNCTNPRCEIFALQNVMWFDGLETVQELMPFPRKKKSRKNVGIVYMDHNLVIFSVSEVWSEQRRLKFGILIEYKAIENVEISESGQSLEHDSQSDIKWTLIVISRPPKFNYLIV